MKALFLLIPELYLDLLPLALGTSIGARQFGFEWWWSPFGINIFWNIFYIEGYLWVVVVLGSRIWSGNVLTSNLTKFGCQLVHLMEHRLHIRILSATCAIKWSQHIMEHQPQSISVPIFVQLTSFCSISSLLKSHVPCL